MRERVAAARKLVEAIRASLPARDASGARHRRPPAASAAAQARPALARPCLTCIRMPLPVHGSVRMLGPTLQHVRTLQALAARARARARLRARLSACGCPARAGGRGAAAAGGHARHAARAGEPGARAARQRA